MPPFSGQTLSYPTFSTNVGRGKVLGGGAGSRDRSEEESRCRAKREDFHVIERNLVP